MVTKSRGRKKPQRRTPYGDANRIIRQRMMRSEHEPEVVAAAIALLERTDIEKVREYNLLCELENAVPIFRGSPLPLSENSY